MGKLSIKGLFPLPCLTTRGHQRWLNIFDGKTPKNERWFQEYDRPLMSSHPFVVILLVVFVIVFVIVFVAVLVGAVVADCPWLSLIVVGCG